MATLNWKGREVEAKVAAAAAAGIDRTMDACASNAASNHPEFPPASEPYERYANRSYTQTASIGTIETAHPDGLTVKGRWGSLNRYALFLEIGTSIAGPTAVEREEAADGNMDAIVPPIGPKMAPRPWARPATDEEYPLLGARIGAAFRGEELL